MPLIAATDLLSELDDDAMRIVDCRWYLGRPDDGAAAYAAGHIPGAEYADLESDLSGPGTGGRHPLPSPEDFDATLRRWGIETHSKVVVYDDRGGAIAARLWWMLTQQGHTDTFLLDGGLHAWREVGGELTTEAPAVSPQEEFAAIDVTDWTGTSGGPAVAGRRDDVVLADARGSERYRGDTEPIDGKAGHIPGAVNHPMTTNLVGPYFKAPDELRSAFAEIGIEENTPAVMHCGSGVTACHNILAMEIAGLGRPDLYVGSWSDWSSSDRPIATGPDPG
jgi:thiosulfate/3-mercaptopyruvate sulfurtransferase